MVAPYAVAGDTFRARKPRDLHPDGQRFAVLKSLVSERDTRRDHLALIIGFADELRRIAPARRRQGVGPETAEAARLLSGSPGTSGSRLSSVSPFVPGERIIEHMVPTGEDEPLASMRDAVLATLASRED